MGILFDIHRRNVTKNVEIVQEAKKDDKIIDGTENTDTTDYTEEADNENPDMSDEESETDDTEDSEADEPTDYTEEAGTDDEEESDESTDNDSEEDSSDVDEPTDYTEEAEDSSSDTSDENSSDDTSSDDTQPDSPPDPEFVKNKALMSDMISLYYSLKSTIGKLDTYTHINMIANRIIVQVKKNFTELIDSVYDYSINSFKTQTYAKNLFMYNSFIESYKINIEMLKKIEIF